MSKFSKLQIRAKVLSVISEVKSLTQYSEDILFRLIEELDEIDDKEALFDVFAKEYIKMDEDECTFFSCLIKELVPKDYVNDKVLESLKSSLSDDAKYKLVQLLRVVGGDYDYDAIPSYFDNPEEVLDKETKKLLENAVFNPESMLDFLDFVSAISAKDRNLLLDSLSMDYQGDVLANIVYPVLYSDFEDNFVLDVIEVLSDSKSSLAIAPFNYLIQTSNNSEIVNACQVGLKKLKLAGATQEKADEYFINIVKDTAPAEFFTTVPDGNGNQALLISRLNTNKKYLLAAVVVNDVVGIVDCFGFYNISQEELIKVLGKFYQSEGKYKVNPEYVKYRVDEAVNITIQNKRKFPYEFICWNPLVKDLNTLEATIIDIVHSKAKKCLITKDEILSLFTQDYTLRWFITPNENEFVKSVTDYIYSSEILNIEQVNSFIKEKIPVIFNDFVENIWKNRFYNLIYLLISNSEEKIANKFYTILNDSNYFSLFKEIIVQRSVFSHFVGLLENSKDSVLTTNIFAKRNSVEAKYDIKKLDSIVEFLKKSWIRG